jgi:hypothetical protein
MRLGVLLVLILTAGHALGQPAPGPAPEVVAHRAADRVEKHIEALHKRLAITPAQQPLWDAFAAVMRSNAAAVEQGHASSQPQPPGNALAELRSLSIRARLHADNMARLLPPFEALYNSMTPEQRTLADATFHQFQRGADAPSRP